MRVAKSYAHGIKRATSEGRMLLLLWLFNILFAWGIYLQFSGYLNSILGTRAAGAGFLKSIDFNIVFELLAFNGAALGQIISMAIFLSFLYGFFSIFLSGGILHTLFAGRGPDDASDRRRLAPLFFQGAGKFFGRFSRLFLYSLVLWAGVVVAMMFLAMVLGPATRGTADEALMFWMFLIAAVVGLFLAFLVKMIIDYARIRIVVDDASAVLGSLFSSIGFVFRRFGKILALYFLFVLTGAALIALYWAVNSGIKTHSRLPILLAFLIGQIFILTRGWVRVGLQAAQMDFFRSAVPPPPPAAPTERIPAPEERITESKEIMPEPGPAPEATPATAESTPAAGEPFHEQ